MTNISEIPSRKPVLNMEVSAEVLELIEAEKKRLGVSSAVAVLAGRLKEAALLAAIEKRAVSTARCALGEQVVPLTELRHLLARGPVSWANVVDAAETIARSDAEFDGRDFEKLGRVDRGRYLARAERGLSRLLGITVGGLEKEIAP